MKRGQTLLGAQTGGSLVSPLVDVVFNLMITMFVFLMIYMAVVVPCHDCDIDIDFMDMGFGFGNPSALSPERTVSLGGEADGWRFSHVSLEPQKPPQAGSEPELPTYPLPDATVYGDYASNIAIHGGQGKPSFVLSTTPEPVPLVVDPNERDPRYSSQEARQGLQTLRLPRVGVLELDVRSGQLNAKFFASAIESGEKFTTISFYVVVIDNRKRISLPESECDPWGVVRLHFYKEAEKGAGDAAQGPSVECLQAVRARFVIRIQRQSIPFDPKANPLRLAVSAKQVDAIEGVPFKEAIPVIGGLESYEYRLNLPRWLRLDKATGTLSAQAPVRGRYELAIEVKDQQTPRGNWSAARDAANEVGTPFARGSVVLNVKPVDPLRATLQLPVYSRTTVETAGAVLNSGGYGKKHFTAEGLPPGLVLDSETGKITGIPTDTGRYSIHAKVTDEHPDAGRNSANAEGEWLIIGPIPPLGFQAGRK